MQLFPFQLSYNEAFNCLARQIYRIKPRWHTIQEAVPGMQPPQVKELTMLCLDITFYIANKSQGSQTTQQLH